jgi:hypothetical protein
MGSPEVKCCYQGLHQQFCAPPPVHNGMVFAFTPESRSPSTGFPKPAK